VSPSARPAAPRIADLVPGVLERTPWPDAEFTVDGRRIQLATLITEILLAADGLQLLTDSSEPPEVSATSVDAAVRLLAGYHVLYSLDPYKVLTHLPHAYEKARAAAKGQREIDLIDRAHGLLQRHLKGA
jgi:hypothetical protein